MFYLIHALAAGTTLYNHCISNKIYLGPPPSSSLPAAQLQFHDYHGALSLMYLPPNIKPEVTFNDVGSRIGHPFPASLLLMYLCHSQHQA